MMVREITNIEHIKKVLCHPEIYDLINDDNSPAVENIEIPISNEYQYIAGYVDNDIIAIMIYHTNNKGIELHIQVLPEYRKEYAREFARIALKFGEAKNAIIYSEIPECYPNVISFAKEFGFIETGSIKNDYIKNDVKHDVVIMRMN